MADQGTGITLTFGTTSFTGEITDISRTGYSRPAVQTTHSSTADSGNTPLDGDGPNARIFIPSDLYDEGEVDVEVHFNAEQDLAGLKKAASETITITFPDAPSHTANGTYTFPGFVTSVDENYSPLDETTMRARMRIKIAGEVTFTAATTS